MASLLESIKRKSQIVVTQVNAIIAAINDKLDMKTGGTIEGNITVKGDITGNLKGNASSADKLKTPQTIVFVDGVTGTATFDGSEDISISVAVAGDSHSHTIDNIDNLETILDNKANSTSPEFEGTPTAPTASSTTNTTQIATTAFVQSVVDSKIAAADAMIYKGTIGSGGTVTSLPNTHKTGWTYKVITAGTYAGVKCNVGDMIICLIDGTSANNAHWTVIEGNIDGAVTGPASSVANNVAIFDGATGKVIKDSGFTIAKSVPANAKFTDTTYTVGTTDYSGTTKLYTSTGHKTDGTINQSVLTTLLSGKLDATANAVSATSDANGNDIASTYATKTALDAKAPLESPALTGTPTAPTATAGISTTQIATTAFVTNAVSGKANNDAVVHTTGDEPVAGNKKFKGNTTFLSTPTIENGGPTIKFKNTNVTLGIPPTTTDEGMRIEAIDSNLKEIGYIQLGYSTGGNTSVSLCVNNPSDPTKNSSLRVACPSSGYPYATAPSTPTGSSGYEIVTADFLNTAINAINTEVSKKANVADVVKLSGNQTIDGKNEFAKDVVVNGSLTIPGGGQIWIE